MWGYVLPLQHAEDEKMAKAFMTKKVAKESEVKTPALYGISHSNRNFSDKYCWGKNQFNSSFPVALCCYMRDKKYGSILISQKGEETQTCIISFDKVFGTTKSNDKLKFCFESAFAPYGEFVEDEMEVIDLVIKDFRNDTFIRPLEIKLTTLPDDGTSSFAEERYGSELVVRSPTMRYLALGIAQKCGKKERAEIQKILQGACAKIRDWGNQAEMLTRRGDIFDALNKFLISFEKIQQPLLIQPIWKTIGKEPKLAENCLDVFTWTDFALARMLYDISISSRSENVITRPQRALLRLARFLYEFSKAGKVYQQPIYDGMTFDTLGDKEFAVNGHKTNKYMSCARLVKPIVRKKEIKNIVLGGGQKYLSPERRFDAILFFSTDLFED